jgi:Protein of unknown function (DUF1579)
MTPMLLLCQSAIRYGSTRQQNPRNGGRHQHGLLGPATNRSAEITFNTKTRRFAMTTETQQKETQDKAANMDVYCKAAAPGAAHEMLARMEGSWTTRTQSWMEPGKPPMESSGTSGYKMLFDGRYLHQEFHGDMMGTPFSGIGIWGYDNQKKKFVSTWIDSMSTGIFYFEGSGDMENHTITQTCRFEDPVRGPMKLRSVTRIVDDKTHVFEMYGTDKSDMEQKMMEITYTRKE